jgi:translation initiation factor eIF-2B subunit delta
MAPLWHACAAAVFDRAQPGTFEHTRVEMERMPLALHRAASLALRDLLTGDPSPLVLTLSYSSSVARVLRDCSSAIRLRVVCAEGRPRFEGRRLATELAESGLDVTLVVDAALTTHLPEASAVVMGADAVTGTHWINKVGSLGVAAAASLQGVPVYVVAGRDKFVPRVLAPRLRLPVAASDEVWPDRFSNVRVENRYFEPTPAELATLVLTDARPVGTSDLPAAVERRTAPITFLLHLLQ